MLVKWRWWSMIGALVAFAPLQAQRSPYADLPDREIKAVSSEQVAQYLAGEGMGLGLAAELNGYPGPRHVLELAGELQLSEAQKNAVQRAFDAMHARALKLGHQIVELERRIDSVFATGQANPESLRADLEKLGGLLAELRFAHLNAHIETKAILSPAQIQQYAALRGYSQSDHETHHHSANHR